MNIDKLFALVRSHLGTGEMESSARSCFADAIRLRDEGDYDRAIKTALKSLAYSVGILHADYAKAWRYSGLSGEARLVS